jgi:SOS response associated peptidase (SRAP)
MIQRLHTRRSTPARRNRRLCTIIQAGVQEKKVLDTGRRLLRVEESSRRKNSVLSRDEGRFAVRVCRVVGGVERSDDQWLRTCTIITGEPNELVREIYTRMPVILQEEHHEAWLAGEAGLHSDG